MQSAGVGGRVGEWGAGAGGGFQIKSKSKARLSCSATPEVFFTPV